MNGEKRRFIVHLQLALVLYVVLMPIGYAALWAGGSRAYLPVNQFFSHMWGSIFILPLERLGTSVSELGLQAPGYTRYGLSEQGRALSPKGIASRLIETNSKVRSLLKKSA